MKREYEHETFAEKFWDWWDNADLSELIIGAAVVLYGLFIVAAIAALITLIVGDLRPADDLPPEEPAEGVAWIMPEAGEVPVWLSPVCTGEAETARLLEEYTEGDGPAPEWWNPDEPMSAEWEEPNPAGYGSNPAQTAENEPLEPRMTISADHFPDAAKMVDGDINVTGNAHPPIGIDPGGVDWNLCSTVWGWDGHMAEIWEIDLFTRVFYLEFWQPDVMLCEAGCDAILRLWESGEKGRTLGEVLSSKSEDGDWTYSVYPQVWETNYDADGLAWCRQLCEERFYKGPEWIAPYFRLDYYHDWAIPAYQIGNVYFSVGG